MNFCPHCWIKLMGMWCLTDGWFSLSLYIAHFPDRKQTWFKDHYIRAIRIVVGLLLIIFG
ncbi:MAG: hypothetical protein WBC98_11285 [Candidatus Zixiibacteriota bacterium]